jgi:hypothetical protein
MRSSNTKIPVKTNLISSVKGHYFYQESTTEFRILSLAVKSMQLPVAVHWSM